MSGNIWTIISFFFWTNAVMRRKASTTYFEYSILFTKCACKFLNVTFHLLEIISPKVSKKVVDDHRS